MATRHGGGTYGMARSSDVTRRCGAGVTAGPCGHQGEDKGRGKPTGQVEDLCTQLLTLPGDTLRLRPALVWAPWQVTVDGVILCAARVSRG
ncbi:hypothetical protein E2562_003806 [Oryza meyeriana var. granulata]|uniref:Uncharacterized protein n=1 Tax=Oryza meyeriana var. granulata TaxID=110450 RepID=A0A6G1BRM1_9ORYZ|nr:hypothetical protein E2562_003806 [Oryza meyeriana var. granulata]